MTALDRLLARFQQWAAERDQIGKDDLGHERDRMDASDEAGIQLLRRFAEAVGEIVEVPPITDTEIDRIAAKLGYQHRQIPAPKWPGIVREIADSLGGDK